MAGGARGSLSVEEGQHMRKFGGMLAAVAALSAAPWVARADDDTEGAKDHPMVQRFAGSIIQESVVRDFEEFEFPVADKDNGLDVKHVEGRFTYLKYSLPKTASCT